ncbi:hypothetical protein [Halalkalibacterium ligniniphilum]|uniref:hypothetical protein n=1 Tax=Halalkalibacterium ligniniphilum TaxID=1134413 RepID=UPI000348CBB1|nr:hypothetical protein [Halalkalibacterium ligniniphilum]
MNNDYQSLLNGIFICGVPAVRTVTAQENVQIAIDLRAEADENEDKDIHRIHIPLVDGKPNQADLLQKAIDSVVQAYKEGKQVVLH